MIAPEVEFKLVVFLAMASIVATALVLAFGVVYPERDVYPVVNHSLAQIMNVSKDCTAPFNSTWGLELLREVVRVCENQ